MWTERPRSRLHFCLPLFDLRSATVQVQPRSALFWRGPRHPAPSCRITGFREFRSSDGMRESGYDPFRPDGQLPRQRQAGLNDCSWPGGAGHGHRSVSRISAARGQVDQAALQPPVGFLEEPHVALHVVALLEKRLGVPFTARRREELTAVDVQRPGESCERVRHRVDRILAEDVDVLRAERARQRASPCRPPRPRSGARRCCPLVRCRCRSPPTCCGCAEAASCTAPR